MRSLTGVAASWKPSCQLCGSLTRPACAPIDWASPSEADIMPNKKLSAATRSALPADRSNLMRLNPMLIGLSSRNCRIAPRNRLGRTLPERAPGDVANLAGRQPAATVPSNAARSYTKPVYPHNSIDRPPAKAPGWRRRLPRAAEHGLAMGERKLRLYAA